MLVANRFLTTDHLSYLFADCPYRLAVVSSGLEAGQGSQPCPRQASLSWEPVERCPMAGVFCALNVSVQRSIRRMPERIFRTLIMAAVLIGLLDLGIVDAQIDRDTIVPSEQPM